MFRREASQFQHLAAIFDKPRSPYNPESIASDAPAMIIGKKTAAILVAREEPFQRRHDRAKPGQGPFCADVKESKLSTRKTRSMKAIPAFSPLTPTSATNERPEP
ncbi:MAG TPA: hypothetical protein PKD21_03935 [Candidatus Competibacter phosphatis]|nr:hypothetical protein [Candidatus Competibacter phosphatis]